MVTDGGPCLDPTCPCCTSWEALDNQHMRMGRILLRIVERALIIEPGTPLARLVVRAKAMFEI